MLLGELAKLEENKEIIVSSFMKANKLKIKRITYISNEGYGSGVNIYIARKDKEFTPLEVFLGLWLKNTIWEEELDDFDYSKDECDKVFSDLFFEMASGYDLKKLSPRDASISLAKAVKKELDNINKENIEVKNPDDIEFLDVSGIYVNKKYTVSPPLILRSNDEIVDAIELFSSDIMGEYEEMFLESKERYIYFF